MELNFVDNDGHYDIMRNFTADFGEREDLFYDCEGIEIDAWQFEWFKELEKA
jgi:hypothetical protein